MAAPNSAYRPYSYFQLVSGAGPAMEHLLALLQTNKATHIARFYLDDIIVVQGTDGTQGVMGVIYPGSVNYQMHNIARHGSLRQNANGVVLNDAGLNTLGFASSNFNFTRNFSNLLHAQTALFRSAWYVNTISYGFEFRKDGETGAWLRHVMSGSALPQQQQHSGLQVIRKSPPLDTFTNYQVRVYLENIEGTYVSSSAFVLTGDYLDNIAFYKRTSACTIAGQITLNVFMESNKVALLSTLTGTPQSLGLIAYKSDVTFEELDTGWYSEGHVESYYYQNGSGFTHKEDCPLTPEVKLTVTVRIYDTGLYDVIATTTVSGSATVPFAGVVEALDISDNVVGSFPVSVTIPSNQLSSTNSGLHYLPNPEAYYRFRGSGSASNARGILDVNIMVVAHFYAET